MCAKMITFDSSAREKLKAGVRDLITKDRLAEAIKSLLGKTEHTKQTRRIDYRELVDDGCINVLTKMNPELVQQYLGAAQAAAGNNVDKTRHTLVSLRTMWEQILSKIAPPAKSLEWLKREGKASKDFIYIKDGEERATKLGRLLYAFRKCLSHDMISAVKNQVKTIKCYLDQLNRVHKSVLNFAKDKLKKFFLLGNTQLNSLRLLFV
ncbi:hypothetical protein [Maridesulfovibrio salexigens]|uniref:Predicted pPIWI-associating nuclease domain-containing protein n=1 Tax=Maridesulfovibrio salexigens (strain ATCC 14822 / DSM 2638 / NCIMB 8403 / VKM B-1763) TaxID=526222 RepID=C6C1U3_MARSD|nr:hypothetical protein [Maridesulfovibrio salexigens]ACS79339.1 hypothetical protein Desal_1276 [Maridesulfovibrio salexigens DSM 2638]